MMLVVSNIGLPSFSADLCSQIDNPMGSRTAKRPYRLLSMNLLRQTPHEAQLDPPHTTPFYLLFSLLHTTNKFPSCSFMSKQGMCERTSEKTAVLLVTCRLCHPYQRNPGEQHCVQAQASLLIFRRKLEYCQKYLAKQLQGGTGGQPVILRGQVGGPSSLS